MTTASMGDVLLERDAELATLERAMAAAGEGHGRAVLIEGSPGIGKTRLLDELARRARDGTRVLRARGGEQERQLSMLATRELFTPYLAGAPADELDRAFSGAAALAGPAVGRETSASPGPDSDFALVHGLYWLIANLADEQPVALLVDDAHWIDEPTQRWLAYLMPRISELPVLLVLAVRPKELSSSDPLAVGMAAIPELITVNPGVLSIAAAAGLVRSVLPRADDEFCRAVHENTGGNPLLLRSLAAAVGEAGLEPTEDGARRLHDIGPLGLGRIVLPRLHRLGGNCVALARAAAVLGDGCTIELARSLADLDRATGLAALDDLIKAEILVQHRHDKGLGFTHPLVRATVTDELATGAAQDLHWRAARLLVDAGADPERAARHLTATDPGSERWAVETLRAAARLASSRGAPGTAVRYATAALREAPRKERSPLLLEASAYAFRDADERGLQWLEEALTVADEPVAATLAWAALVNWRLIMSAQHEPEQILDELPRHADLDPELQLMVRAQFLLDYGFTGAQLRTRLDLCPEPAEMNEGTVAVHLYRCALALDEAFRGASTTRTLEIVRSVDLVLVLTAAGDTLLPAALCMAAMAAGDLDGAVAVADRMLEHATRTGSIIVSEGATSVLAHLALERGDIAQAEALVNTSLQLSPDFVTPISRPSQVANLLRVECERNRLDRAEKVLDRWPDLAADPPATWHGARFRYVRGDFRLLAGDPTLALDDARSTAEILRDNDAADCPSVPWRLLMAASLARLGRTTEARETAEEQLAVARRFGAAPLLGASLRTLGSLVGAVDGRQLLEESVDVLDGSGAHDEHTRTLLVLGRSLRMCNHAAAAREPLQRALHQAEAGGAARLAQLAEEELRLTGARPRRRAVTGVQSLTPAELRVATMAGQGLSNPEIAQSLFVTRKTVEKHLGSVFQKLHITSRDQLPVVLADADA